MIKKSKPKKVKYYKNPFLKTVLLKINFSTILSIKKELLSGFLREISANFPDLTSQDAIDILFKIEKNVSSNTHNNIKYWIFRNNEKSQKLTITHEYLSLEFFEYENFENFFKIAKLAFDTFFKYYKDLSINRIGLRYINEVKFSSGKPLEWSEYINCPLTYSIDNFISDKSKISRCMSQAILNYDDFHVIFNYGIFNPEYPAKVNRKEYILDYDCFTKEIDHDDPLNCLSNFNIVIYDLYEKSITDKLRKHMGVIYEK